MVELVTGGECHGRTLNNDEEFRALCSIFD